MSENNRLEKEIIPDAVIDAKGLNSPVPLLRLKRELSSMKDGETVQIDCTDASCAGDIANWCSRMSYNYRGEKEHDGYTSCFLSK